VQCLVKKLSKNYSSSQINMISSLRLMNVIRRYILMKILHPLACYRPRQIWDEMITNVVWSFIAFQNAQMSPACDPVLSQVTPISFRPFFAIVPTMVAPCLYTHKWQALSPGRMKITCMTTEPCIERSLMPF